MQKLIGFSVLALACVNAMAQTDPVTTQVVQQAIETNPEISARFNAFRASVADIDASFGALLPKVDLTGEMGRTNDVIKKRTPSESQYLNRTGVAISISQLLWDGQATTRDVARLGHTRLARYFELMDATEQTALEAVRSLVDVQRYRRLVQLAEDNYVQHKFAFEQIQSRVRAGVSRGVDQEQSAARLALAESNLITERSNLHDVVERYRRIVGSLPPADLPAQAGSVAKAIPASSTEAMEATASRSPAVAAAVESMRAARSQAENRQSAYHPRIEARLRAGAGQNFDGTEGQKRDVTGQLIATWNIFNGGIDDARIRSTASQLSQAMDLRDKACRDSRQTTAIAFNDARKLVEQIGYLERNVASIAKARDAYRQQFDIGQRSLLDLLNAENELYTARRALAVAQFDQTTAVARTHAAMGSLTTALGLTRPEPPDDASEAKDWAAGDDAASRCPLSATDLAQLSREELDSRVRVLMDAARPATAAPATASAVGAADSKPVVTPLPPGGTTTTTIGNSASATAQAALDTQIKAWLAAWSGKDLKRYLDFYSPQFQATGMSRELWATSRERRFAAVKGPIQITVSGVKTTLTSATTAETRFTQNYQSSGLRDVTEKTLQWVQEDGQWRILRESNR